MLREQNSQQFMEEKVKEIEDNQKFFYNLNTRPEMKSRAAKSNKMVSKEDEYLSFQKVQKNLFGTEVRRHTSIV
jgi:hypothetical protein